MQGLWQSVPRQTAAPCARQQEFTMPSSQEYVISTLNQNFVCLENVHTDVVDDIS